MVGDARTRLARGGCLQTFLALNHLVQAAFPRTVGHDTSSELVDDLDLAVSHDVVAIQGIAVQRSQGLCQQPLTLDLRIRQTRLLAVLEYLLASVEQFNVAVSRHHLEVHLLVQRFRQRQCAIAFQGGRAAATGAGDDQRRTRLVHEDAVGFVDEGVPQAPHQRRGQRRVGHAQASQLCTCTMAPGQGLDAVAQVVKGEVLVDAIGHPTSVGQRSLGGRLFRQHLSN